MSIRRSVIGAVPLGAAVALLMSAGAAQGQPCEGGWSEVGGGLSQKDDIGPALAMPIVFDDGDGPALYALGHTDFAGNLPVDNFARWDGQSWTAPSGGGLTESTEGKLATNVFDALIHDDGSGPAIFAGGMFGKAGGQSVMGIAKWDGKAWSPLGSGLAGGHPPQINAMTTWDPDGGGPAARVLVVGGWFESVGGVAAARIAVWDGHAWSAMGAGIPGDGPMFVNGLAVFDDGGGERLYAGIAGKNGYGSVRSWDGQNWVELDAGFDGYISTLAVHDDGRGPALYIGGSFTHAGGIDALRLALWDGQTWEAVGGGIGTDGYAWVEGFATVDLGSGPELVVFGDFDAAGGLPAGNLAAWNGERWERFDGGVSGDGPFVMGVSALDDGSGPALFALGDFLEAGGVEAVGAARFALCPPCYADFNADGSLDLFDFLAFVNAFNAQQAQADCDGNGVFDLFDFLCFVNAFNAGC